MGRLRAKAMTLCTLGAVTFAACGEPFESGGGTDDGGCTADEDCGSLDDVCQLGWCDQGQCATRVAPEGTACDDGLFCTEGDTCSGGVCGTPVQCQQPQQPCQRAVCREQARGCANEPVEDDSPCDDGDPCTSGDACVAGACSTTPVTTCQHGDGCCPDDCTSAADDDCACRVNLALQATATSSGGGTDSFGPEQMNDGRTQAESCMHHWITNSSTSVGTFIELSWPAEVSVASLFVDTDHELSPSSCINQPGRNLAGGEVQAWVAGAWTTIATIADEVGDVQIDFPPTVTNGLRIYDAVSGPGNGNTVIYEWLVYADSGCAPDADR